MRRHISNIYRETRFGCLTGFCFVSDRYCNFQTWISRYIDGHKRIGAVLFVVSYTVACTLFLPGSLFTIGAGFLFKPFPLALLIVLLGDVFAAVGSFVFGRYVFYDWVKGMMSKHPKFGALDQVIQDDGNVSVYFHIRILISFMGHEPWGSFSVFTPHDHAESYY